LILCEDRYGKPFFEKFVERLKNEELIRTSQKVDVKHLPGKCYPKTDRVLRALDFKDISKIIIVADAEGGDLEHAREEVEQHVPNHLKDLTRYVILPYSIEDWLCDGLNIGGSKSIPSFQRLRSYVRNTRGESYEKNMLPEFASKIDIELLRGKNEEFKKFIDYLNYL
jgi:hypothetical protein